ncbi:uncharacterized protein ACOB8E_023946 isoform 1-T1 [Sarcophilus harrisii]
MSFGSFAYSWAFEKEFPEEDGEDLKRNMLEEFMCSKYQICLLPCLVSFSSELIFCRTSLCQPSHTPLREFPQETTHMDCFCLNP